MDFKQIEAFINVARFKSFSKAGEAIYLSQPTISTHINTLENELAVSLFDRSGKDVQLTPAGLLFYDYAINMLNTRDEAVYSIAEFYNRIEGEVYIASSTTPCRFLLPVVIKGFSKIYPNVNFKISEKSSGDVIHNVLHYNAEIGIVGKRVLKERLVYTEFAEDNLVLITPFEGRFSQIKDTILDFNDIKSESFILRESSSATRQIFETALTSAGYSIDKLKIFSEVNSIDAVLQFVRYGLGITVISENAAKEYIESNLVKRFYIRDLPLNRKIYMVKHEKRTLSPAAKALESYVLSYYGKPSV